MNECTAFDPASISTSVRQMLKDPLRFTRFASGLRLRRYQVNVMQAVIDSIIHRKGLSFVVIFPRQSGKNELQAHIETYLLAMFCQSPVEIVKLSPTWRPQAQNAMRRLERILKHNIITCDRWKKESGYAFSVGDARITFLSASPESSIVGATASLLLEVDEAQDVQPEKFDKDIAPMAASTNATRVFWGTAWTASTLLGRELRTARSLEAQDGIPRAFVLTAEDVAAEVPSYALFIAAQISRLGRTHPLVRTQYFSEEIDAESGMFPPDRQALMQGSHPRRETPAGEGAYAFLLDVAGEAAQPDQMPAWSGSGTRDSSALTIVEVLPAANTGFGSLSIYRVLNRRAWLGVAHTRLLAEIRALATLWHPRCLVVDATGVGAGLASFLENTLSCLVIRFLFTTSSKSKLGWDFLSICDTGRFQDYSPRDHFGVDDFTRQLNHCRSILHPGPENRIQWGVPDGTRDPASGEFIHDDWIMSAALTARLEDLPWPSASGVLIAHAVDPLKDMDKGF